MNNNLINLCSINYNRLFLTLLFYFFTYNIKADIIEENENENEPHSAYSFSREFWQTKTRYRLTNASDYPNLTFTVNKFRIAYDLTCCPARHYGEKPKTKVLYIGFFKEKLHLQKLINTYHFTSDTNEVTQLIAEKKNGENYFSDYIFPIIPIQDFSEDIIKQMAYIESAEIDLKDASFIIDLNISIKGNKLMIQYKNLYCEVKGKILNINNRITHLPKKKSALQGTIIAIVFILLCCLGCIIYYQKIKNNNKYASNDRP